MSINRTDYLIIGINIIEHIKSMDCEEIEALEKKVNKSGEITLIYDWMNENFCYIGKVLRKSGKYEDGETVNFDLLDLEDLVYGTAERLHKIYLLLNDNIKVPIRQLGEVELIAFTQYL